MGITHTVVTTFKPTFNYGANISASTNPRRNVKTKRNHNDINENYFLVNKRTFVLGISTSEQSVLAIVFRSNCTQDKRSVKPKRKKKEIFVSCA